MQPAPVDAKRASSSFTHSIDEVDATGAGGSAAIENRFGSSHYGGLDHSESCGLLFLISLLERLAIGQLLSDNPALAEINLPAVVLRDIALRLRLPPSHPLLQALPHTPPVEHRIARLRVPSIWRDLAAAPEREVSGLHLFRSPAAAYHLTNRSRNILLHAGRGDLPEWTRQYRVTEHRGAYQPPRVADLSRSLQLLMSRYLRRHARMSLRQLVHRPGRIAATRTHLDALFDFQQMDIRIRRAGLDLNPGWVAWLARVVQFHYEEQDTEHV